MVLFNRLVLVIWVLILVTTPAQAYFKDIGTGARPLGMGGAYTAVADDSNAVLWNSSGLAQIENNEITAMYSALYVGLNGKLYNEKTDNLGYHFVCYAHPSSLGSFAISWSTFQSQIYDENIFCFSYGRKISRNLCAGLNLKNMGWKVGSNEFTVLDKDIPDHGISVNTFTADLSALYKSDDGLSLGISAENLIPVDVGLNMEEEIPLNMRFGMAYRIDNLWRKNIDLLSAIDITYRDNMNDIHAGAEVWLFDKILCLRAGWNPTSATSGVSWRFSSTKWEMQVDYGFVYPLLIQNTYGSHRTSISIRF